MLLFSLNCAHCYREFKAKKKEINRGRKFCSKECVHASRDKGLRFIKNDRAYKSSSVLTQYGHVKTRARNKGIPCSEKDDFLRWYFTTQRSCEYCSIPEETFVNLFGNPATKLCLRLEIDKKSPDLGYVVGNMVLSCRCCNAVKCEFISYDEMKEIGEKYMKAKWQIKLIVVEPKVEV